MHVDEHRGVVLIHARGELADCLTDRTRSCALQADGCPWRCGPRSTWDLRVDHQVHVWLLHGSVILDAHFNDASEG